MNLADGIQQQDIKGFALRASMRHVAKHYTPPILGIIDHINVHSSTMLVVSSKLAGICEYDAASLLHTQEQKEPADVVSHEPGLERD